MLDKLLNEFILPSEAAPERQQKEGTNTDMVTNHALQLLQYFFLLEDFKDAVKEGNGLLNQLHKQLLHYFKTDDGHNFYAIEMLISVIQNEVFLNDAEAHQCTWAATANSKGGKKKNIEIDLLQENINADLKKMIKNMGANKTDKAVVRASKSVCGLCQIVDNFDQQTCSHKKSTHHSHASSFKDESKILEDLHKLKPFIAQPNRNFGPFIKITSNPLDSLNKTKFCKWLERHKKNIMYNAPYEESEDIDDILDNKEALDIN